MKGIWRFLLVSVSILLVFGAIWAGVTLTEYGRGRRAYAATENCEQLYQEALESIDNLEENASTGVHMHVRQFKALAQALRHQTIYQHCLARNKR